MNMLVVRRAGRVVFGRRPVGGVPPSHYFAFSTTTTTPFADDKNDDNSLDFTVGDADGYLREVETVKRGIRVSPRKMNLLAKQIRGMSVPEALLQMKFSVKRHAPLVAKTVQNATNLADINYTLLPKQLEIAEAFVGKGKYLKRLRLHAKGRFGIVHKKSCHLTVKLREIDFDDKIESAGNERQRKRWVKLRSEVAHERRLEALEEADNDGSDGEAAEEKKATTA